MRCDDVRALLSAAIDGEDALTPAARAHLAGCAACRAWQAEVTELERLFAAPVAVPRGVVPRVTNRLVALGPRGRRAAGRGFAVAVLVALPAGTAAARLADRDGAHPVPRALPPATASPAPVARASHRPTTPPPAVTRTPTSTPAVTSTTPPPPATAPAATAPATKPLAAERTEHPFHLALTAHALQDGAITATLTLTNLGAGDEAWDSYGCTDLTILVDGEQKAGPAPSCAPYQRVTLRPRESRTVTVRVPAEPGTYEISGMFFRAPDRDGSGTPARIRTSPLRVRVA